MRIYMLQREQVVPLAPAGTRMRDVVRYALPLRGLGRLARALLVRRDLERIFNFRRDAVAALFGEA